jgi:methylase of polypeptide subunit release factors
MLLGKLNVCILGMDVIRNILRGAKGWVRKGGTIWLEVDPMHPKMIEEFLHQEPDIGIELLQVFMDMSGVARYCKLLVT